MSQTIYNNVVLGNKWESVLATKLNLLNYVTVDSTLAQDAGMVKRIISRTATGSVDKVSMTQGNTNVVEVGTTSKDYTVGMVQGRFNYYDEEAMADPAVVDAGIEGTTEIMVNQLVADIAAEWDKATLQQGYSSIGFNTIADAIAQMNLENEDGLFILINPSMLATFRKAVKSELSYSEAFVRTGYIGSLVNIPVFVCKAVPNGICILASNEAVTLFLKKDNEIEQERDADHRKNSVFMRKCYIAALTDASKVVKIGATQATDATITTYTKAQKHVEGAATTGAEVYVYINGVLAGHVTAASSAYDFTNASNLTAGDEIKVVAKKAGCVDSVAEATVAA